MSNHVLKVSSSNQLVSGYPNCDFLHPSRQIKLQNLETAQQNLAVVPTSDRRVIYKTVENRGVVHSWESVRYNAEGCKALAWERQCHRWPLLGIRQHSNVHMNDVIYYHYSWNQNGNKKKVIKTKYHKESAAGRQIQANKQKEKNSQQAASSSSIPQQNASSTSKPANVIKSLKGRVTSKV